MTEQTEENKKNFEFNLDRSLFGVYSDEVDIAFIIKFKKICEVIKPINFKVNYSSNNYREWNEKGLQENDLIIKIGSKTGISFGHYAGIKVTTPDDKNTTYIVIVFR